MNDFLGSPSQEPAPREDAPELHGDARIEFICGSVVTAVLGTPVAYAFLYHTITGDKVDFASAAVLTGIVAVVAGLWAWRARPGRLVRTMIFVVVPLLMAITTIALRIATW